MLLTVAFIPPCVCPVLKINSLATAIHIEMTADSRGEERTEFDNDYMIGWADCGKI